MTTPTSKLYTSAPLEKDDLELISEKNWVFLTVLITEIKTLKKGLLTSKTKTVNQKKGTKTIKLQTQF